MCWLVLLLLVYDGDWDGASPLLESYQHLPPILLGEEPAITLMLSFQVYCLLYELCALNPSVS